MRIIKELEIARISGWKYPDSETESQLFKYFLDIPRQFYYDNIFFIINSNNEVPSSHLINSSIQCYPYGIMKITTKDDIDDNNSNDSNDINSVDCFVSSKQYTNVILRGCINKKIPIHNFSYELIKSFLNHNSNNDYFASNSNSISLLYPVSSYGDFIQVNSYNNNTDNSNTSAVTSENVSVIGKNYNCSPYSITTATIMETLYPIFNFVSNDIAIHFSLMKDPILISHSHCGVTSKDMECMLEHCAMRLDVRYVTIDTRLLVRYTVKQSYESLSNVAVTNQMSAVLLQDISIEEVLTNSPCVINITHFDRIYDDPTLQHGNNEEDSLENTFISSFQQFISDLYSKIHSNIDNNSADGREEDSSSGSIASSPINDNAVVIIITTELYSSISTKLKSLFSNIIDINSIVTNATATACKEQYRDSIIYSESDVKNDVEQHINRTFNSNDSQAKEFVNALRSQALSRYNYSNWLKNINSNNIVDSYNNNIVISKQDFEEVKCQMPHLDGRGSAAVVSNSNSQSVSANIAPVHWEDIGGLDRVRKEILDVLELPFKYPDLFLPGCPRRQGVLLYGPPGTGKTLVAKAVATECEMSFLSVKGPELLDAYIGESEKNVRNIFSRAREMAPCVLFFDEIDSLAPARAKSRGGGSESGCGVMDRIVSQLLTEIDLLVAANSSSSGNNNNEDSENMLDNNTSMTGSNDCNNNNNSDESKCWYDNLHCSNSSNYLENFKSNNMEICGMPYHTNNNNNINNDIKDNNNNNNPLQESTKHTKSSSIINNTTSNTITNNRNVKSNFVFIIAATNRPDLLDTALLRPGRFDRKIYLGVCKDITGRSQILKAQTRNYSLSSDVDLDAIAGLLPDNVTGADIGAVTSTAFSLAMNRKLKQLQYAVRKSTSSSNVEEYSSDSDSSDNEYELKTYINQLPESELLVTIDRDDFATAIATIKPSVIDNLSYYESLEEIYDDTRVVS